MSKNKEKLEQELEYISKLKARRDVARDKLLATQREESKPGLSETDIMRHKSRRTAIERVIFDLNQQIESSYSAIISIQEKVVYEELCGDE